MPDNDDRRRALDLVPELLTIEPQLRIYEEMLRSWQKRVNLVGPSTVDRVWTRHFADSAQLAALSPLAVRWADLGSGAGFPGLVVSLLQGHSSGEMHLIESDKRKAAFLREVSRETGATAIVDNGRVDDILDGLSPKVITSRAMANLATLFKHSQRLVENGALGLFMKGRDIEAELTAASIPSRFCVKLVGSKVDAEGMIILISRC